MKDSTVKDLDELHRKARAAQGRLRPVWLMNLAYYKNYQWVGWNGRNLFRPSLRRDRMTITDNRITPIIRTEIARMTQTAPVYSVSPNSPDQSDAEAAELGDRLMIYLPKHLSLSPKCVRALEWSRVCGAGFLKAFWDPTIGEGNDYIAGPDGKVVRDPKGAPMRAGGQNNPMQLNAQLGLRPNTLRTKTLARGDIRVEVRSPFQMFVDPLAELFDEAEWVIEENVVSQDAVLQRYGVTIEPDVAANPGLVEAQLGGVLSPGSNTYKGVKIKEYWHKPDVNHPNGCRTVWTKDRVLLEDDKPFDPIPYVMFSGTPSPGTLWPMGLAELLRGPQDELNKVKSQIAENRNRVGNPTILASKQAVQNPNQFNDSISQPGTVYYFDDTGSANAVPTYLQAPPLPQYVIDEIQRIEESLQEISGQHEVSSAQVPPGVTAASAINLLLETDNTRLGPAMRDYEQQLGKLGTKVLKLAAKYYDDSRTIRIVGDNGTWQIFPFRGTMLKGNTHVEVQAGSAWPASKAAKQAAMVDLMNAMIQSGNPPHGKEFVAFLRSFDIGGADKWIEEYTRDEQAAERENVMLSQGEAININPWDNDEVHLATHGDDMKSPSFFALPSSIQQLKYAHWQAHQQRMQEQQQAQMQQEAMMQNGGQPPGPSPLDQQGQVQQQGIDAAQADQQQNIQAAQAQHGIEAKTAQQGQQMAQNAESTFQQLRQQEERHRQDMAHKDELHKARLAQMRTQPVGGRK